MALDRQTIIEAMKLAAAGYKQSSLDRGTFTACTLVVLVGGNDYRSRLAMIAYRRFMASRIILTGPADRVDASRQFLEGQGVPPRIIEIEPTARTTRQNAEKVAAMLTPDELARPILVVTNSWHWFRAAPYFQKNGFKHVENWGDERLPMDSKFASEADKLLNEWPRYLAAPLVLTDPIEPGGGGFDIWEFLRRLRG